jgi:hypothetical protein
LRGRLADLLQDAVRRAAPGDRFGLVKQGQCVAAALRLPMAERIQGVGVFGA